MSVMCAWILEKTQIKNSEVASATEEEETERGDQKHSLEGGNDFEKDIIYEPKVQIEPLLPPQSSGALQLPPPRAAAAPARLLMQPPEEKREIRRRTRRLLLHDSDSVEENREVCVSLFVFEEI